MPPIITITRTPRGWCVIFTEDKYRAVRWFCDAGRAGEFTALLLEHGVNGLRMIPLGWLLEGDGRD